jgi:hypothetical protein
MVTPVGTSYQVFAQSLKSNQVYQSIWTPE